MTTRERAARVDGRSPSERADDHASIDRLADELLPALVARLGTTGLGELEVREGTWRVRLRRPPGADRAGGGAGRPGSGRAARSGRSEERSRGDGTTGSAGPQGVAEDPTLPPLTSVVDPAPAVEPGPLVAVSPAVGIFRLAKGTKPGTRVRSGDRLADVDLLGVPQEVVAPADAVVAEALVDDGDAVEYGQPLIALDPLGRSTVAGRPDAVGAGPAEMA
jgi:acetyl-CoA carboxylase biotin carboxyl carrier protein